MKALPFLLAASVLFSASAHAGKRLSIPADVRATYSVVDKGWQGGDRIIVTKRTSREGTRYAKRLYDCEANTVKLLGEGKTLEAMEAATPESEMGSIVPESVTYYISLEACKYLKES